MSTTLYDTLSRETKEVAWPKKGALGIYVCGPTVYDLSHIGHARVYIVFDVLVRRLRQKGPVAYVRNLTDIDDKIIARAAKASLAPTELAASCAEDFRRDMQQLGCLPADVEPKVSDHVEDIVAMIGELVASGHAYAAGGNVYFAVDRFATYGRLGKRTLEDMEAGARVEVSALKRNPMDFALWKAVKPGEPSWPSPWGAGRPGWHIECSAMSRRYLGSSFAIHGGGRDLIFPHHENEIAQSEAVSGRPLAQIWAHNGLVNINDQKMSKSLGNFFLVRDVLARFNAQALRLFLLSSHYRAPLAFSDAGLAEATVRLAYINQTLERVAAVVGGDDGPLGPDPFCDALRAGFLAAIDQDLNTPLALGHLSQGFRLCNELLDRPARSPADHNTLRAVAATLAEVGAVLGLFTEDSKVVLARLDAHKQRARGVDESEIVRLVEARGAARRRRDWTAADQLRQKLATMGVEVRDDGDESHWRMR